MKTLTNQNKQTRKLDLAIGTIYPKSCLCTALSVKPLPLGGGEWTMHGVSTRYTPRARMGMRTRSTLAQLEQNEQYTEQ